MDYSLEGCSNYISWKDKMEAVLDDNGLKEFIDADIPKPASSDAAALDAWQKKIAKCRRILLEGVKDHIVSNLHGKASSFFDEDPSLVPRLISSYTRSDQSRSQPGRFSRPLIESS